MFAAAYAYTYLGLQFFDKGKDAWGVICMMMAVALVAWVVIPLGRAISRMGRLHMWTKADGSEFCRKCGKTRASTSLQQQEECR